MSQRVVLIFLGGVEGSRNEGRRQAQGRKGKSEREGSTPSPVGPLSVLLLAFASSNLGSSVLFYADRPVRPKEKHNLMTLRLVPTQGQSSVNCSFCGSPYGVSLSSTFSMLKLSPKE